MTGIIEAMIAGLQQDALDGASHLIFWWEWRNLKLRHFARRAVMTEQVDDVCWGRISKGSQVAVS